MKSNLQSVQRNPTLFLTHILICAVVSYLGGKFSLTMYSVGKADSQVASLGREYIEGGIEYYERLIKRNKLIRKLNKNAPFTEEGEKKEEWSNLFIVPFAIRINFLKKCLEAVNTNQKNPSLWTHYLTF